MIRVVLALLAGLTTVTLTRAAEANSCSLYHPAVASTEVPIGCPVVLFAHEDVGLTDLVATVRGDDGQPVDVTGAITRDRTMLKVPWHLYEPKTCEEHAIETVETFDVLSIELEGVAVGAVVTLQGLGGEVHIVDAAATCPTTPPAFYCNEPVCTPEGGWDYDDDEGGCNTSGSNAGLGLALALLAIARGRFTPSRTARAR